MSGPDDLIDRVNELLKEHVIDCLYRIERLEQIYLAREPDGRLPQLSDPEDTDEAMKDLQKRLEIVERIAEQSE